ncbi:TetR/AcrR family transcriptional regulator [Pseudorhodoferax sp.]|uniref:TetR/AcrR family transcriptional regulator n=1 Tax=Pseudorhodoferax sp. TaxID=1993553 RepID=UPI0039E22F12
MPRPPKRSAADPGPVVRRAGGTLPKGRQTKAAIVDAALGLASQIGLEGLSIGAVAELTGMSKSGVFAHFGSREELQIAVVREYGHRFEDEVFHPALQVPRGLQRLRALFANWMKRVAVELQSGCIFISGAAEFDDRPGPVRDALVGSVKAWLAALDRAVALAQETGELRPDADARQMAFEIHGLILALHYEERFLHRPGSLHRAEAGFEHILARYRATTIAAPAAPSPPAARPRAQASHRHHPSRPKE